MTSTFTAGQQWASAYAQGHPVASTYKDGQRFWQRPSVTLTNLLTNGSFETDTAGWTGSLTLSRQPLDVAHGENGSWRGQNAGTVNGAHWFQRSAALTVVNGRQYYLRCQTAVATAGYGNVVQFQNTTTALAGVASITLPAANEWQLYDAIWTANTTSLTLRVNHSGGSGNQTRTGWLDNVMVLDLTATFGAGSVPPIGDVRDLVASGGGWWDGTLAV